MCFKLRLLFFFLFLLLFENYSVNCESVCNADVSINSVTKPQLVKKYNEDKISLWVSVERDFKCIEITIVGSKRIHHRFNLTIDDIRAAITKTNFWHKLSMEIVYEYKWLSVSYVWHFFISVNDNPRMNFKIIDWGYPNEHLEFINITAYGPSKWRFTEPQTDICIVNPRVLDIEIENENDDGYYEKALQPNCCSHLKMTATKLLFTVTISTIIIFYHN